ncbi:M28 family peptidase [Microbacterium sp. NPDC089698]|uniref:M28 family peptidase n=1 Tax=Microbacterium sp. NPDC089698 TaxID=3364200 RepID=UPI00380E4C21
MSVTKERILATIEDLVALAPRATGSPGGAAAAAYVEDRFARAGLDTEILEVPSFAWRATECGITVGGGAEVPCSPILHSALPAHDWAGSVRHVVEAPVVDIGSDRVRRHDVRGAIVLFDLTFDMTLAHTLPITMFLHDPGRRVLRRDVLRSRNPYVTSLARTMRDAAAAGAVGVIGVLRDYPDSLGYHNEYYRRTLFRLPGAWVTRAGGARLRAELRRSSGATLTLGVTREEVVSRTVIGVLPGGDDASGRGAPGRSAGPAGSAGQRGRRGGAPRGDAVMIQSHHDSVGAGAVEDASGAAEVIALAEHYAAEAAAGRRPAKTLLFTTFDTHFTGYQAHREFARQHVLSREAPWRIVLNATIEHIGLRAVEGPDGGFASTGETEPRGIFLNVNPAFTTRIAGLIRRHRMHATSILGAGLLEFFAGGIPTDASFTFVSGVPTVSLISGPLYLYDDADTIERIDTAQLEPVARFFIDIVDDADRHRGSLLGTLPSGLRRLLPRGRW